MLQFNSSHTFFAGGYSDAGSYSEAYFYYDGIFHPLSEMLTPRSHHMCARYRGEIILAGGWHPGYDYMDTVEIFNPELNRWRTGLKHFYQSCDNQCILVRSKTAHPHRQWGPGYSWGSAAGFGVNAGMVREKQTHIGSGGWRMGDEGDF